MIAINIIVFCEILLLLFFMKRDGVFSNLKLTYIRYMLNLDNFSYINTCFLSNKTDNLYYSL